MSDGWHTFAWSLLLKFRCLLLRCKYFRLCETQCNAPLKKKKVNTVINEVCQEIKTVISDLFLSLYMHRRKKGSNYSLTFPDWNMFCVFLFSFPLNFWKMSLVGKMHSCFSGVTVMQGFFAVAQVCILLCSHHPDAGHSFSKLHAAFKAPLRSFSDLFSKCFSGLLTMMMLFSSKIQKPVLFSWI